MKMWVPAEITNAPEETKIWKNKRAKETSTFLFQCRSTLKVRYFHLIVFVVQVNDALENL
jgi:hypothetical protein